MLEQGLISAAVVFKGIKWLTVSTLWKTAWDHSTTKMTEINLRSTCLWSGCFEDGDQVWVHLQKDEHAYDLSANSSVINWTVCGPEHWRSWGVHLVSWFLRFWVYFHVFAFSANAWDVECFEVIPWKSNVGSVMICICLLVEPIRLSSLGFGCCPCGWCLQQVSGSGFQWRRWGCFVVTPLRWWCNQSIGSSVFWGWRDWCRPFKNNPV